jgi:tyrosine-protein kinase Etk/Wzc
MSDTNLNSPLGAEHAESEIGLLDILIALLKHTKLLIGLPVIAGLLVAGITLLIPNTYKASTKLLPPSQTQSTASAMLSQIGGLAGAFGGGVLGMKTQTDLYIGMMHSRTVTDNLIKRFDLLKLYQIESWEAARKIVAAKISISAGKDGLILIDVIDRNPKLAADMANAMVDELVKLTSQFAITDASQRRVFFEKQLLLTNAKLAEAETALKSSLDKSGVVSVDGKSQGMVMTVERLRASISSKEIQLKSMSAFVTPNNVDYKRMQEELSSMRSELSKLENGSNSDSKDDAKSSESGLASVKLLRDVKYYQTLYELLAKQYEVARLDESKDFSMVQVLDKAIVPENKIAPQRALTTIAAAVFCFILVLLYILWLELIRKKADEKSKQKWELLRASFKFWK